MLHQSRKWRDLLVEFSTKIGAGSMEVKQRETMPLAIATSVAHHTHDHVCHDAIYSSISLRIKALPNVLASEQITFCLLCLG